MIARPTPLSASAWRNLVHACIEEGDVEACIRSLVKATHDREVEVEPGKFQTVLGDRGAQELLLRYTVGTPYRAPQPPEKQEVFKLVDIEDLQDCTQAMNDVIQAELRGEIGPDQSKSLRESITAAATIYRSQRDSKLLEDGIERGSLPLTLRAGIDPVDAFREAYIQASADEADES